MKQVCPTGACAAGLLMFVRRTCKRSGAMDSLNRMTEGMLGERDIPLVVAGADELEACYARRARQLWSFGRRLGLDPEAAEEAMQEAFARAMRLERGTVRDLDPWLFQVVHNLAIDSLRRSRRLNSIREIQAGPATHRDDALALWQEVDRLPERQRAVVYLRFRADLEFGAIATILGITDGGARANCARALATLRKWMAEP